MSNKPLWSDDKTEDDIIYHAQTDSDTVIYNLLEDIKCLKEDGVKAAETVTIWNPAIDPWD